MGIFQFLFGSSGRIGRLSFWLSAGPLLLIQLLEMTPFRPPSLGLLETFLAFTFYMFGYLFGEMGVWVLFLIILPLIGGIVIYVTCAILAKRWHDIDRSGRWSLILIIPILGPAWVLFECGFMRGTVGVNRFGDDPLAGR